MPQHKKALAAVGASLALFLVVLLLAAGFVVPQDGPAQYVEL